MSVVEENEKRSTEEVSLEKSPSSQDIYVFFIDPLRDKELWRKLDRNLMPIISVLFLLSFL